MGIDRLGEFAKETALKTKIAGTVSGRALCRRAEADLKRIRGAAGRCTGRSAGEEWLLDNRYIADREGQNVVADLRNVKNLPKNGGTGHAAVYDAAAALVSSCEGRIDEKRLAVFLDGYQQGRTLAEREIGAFIPSVKAALIGLLARGCGDPDPAVMENIFTSLRFFDGFQSAGLLESVDRIDTLLRTDPAGIYPKMDETTRMKYRQQVSRLAEKRDISELEAAKRAVELARESGEHVGLYLFRKPLGESQKGGGAGWYIASIVIISLFLTVFLSVALDSVVIGLLLLLPIWDTVKNMFDFAAVKLTPPAWIPRLELKNGIPADCRTLCVISILLTGEDCARQAAERLEQFSITNSDAGPNLMFGLLADLKESETETTEGDEKLIRYTEELIDELNRRRGDRFRLFIRPRVWSEASGKFMGWERKRGAVLELARLVRGRQSGIIVRGGEVPEMRYVITLDSDTRLTAGAAVQLVGAAMHPLNRPKVEDVGVVSAGFGIIAPRMSVELKSAGQSDFTRIFAGQGGIDPYGGSVSDVYQDVFGCGSFTGKGLIDADVYLRCLDGRFPTDRILSHDLLEGAFIGCGYMSDLELADSTPGKVTSHFERSHRWIRGDWQNCVYLGGKLRDEQGNVTKNPLSELNKWKIFENLRRSATPVFTMAALLAGMLTGHAAMTTAALVGALSAVSGLLITSAELLFKKRPPRRIRYLSNIINGFGGLLMQTIIKLMLLPYEAWISLSAIGTALYRLTVTKRNLLQWTTAADSDRGSGGTVAFYYKKMAACAVTAVLIFLVTPYAANVAVGIVWLLTPFYAWALSKRIDRKKPVPEGDRRFLLSEAGQIWRFFEDTVTAADSFLPPDNVQEQPDTGVAHRTSPTNIGLCLLSALAAVDLKLTDRRRGLEMIENVLTSVERLEKWNGHLYNWYDTRTMKPLEPVYVSSVDSGNLAACLAALKEGLRECGEWSLESGDVLNLADRAETLYNDMNFAPLYNAKRRLFHIGWDCAANRPADSYYDLLASEARQTSYVAIAKGDAPRRHWRTLSRALVSYEGYCGMASWTGTMFEYLMPNLLLPCYQDSLLYESARFCVFVQKSDRRAPVWGVSESGYWELDSGLNYRYKAHGIQTLGLKRGLGRDVVISPYSSFLALSVDFRTAVANLRALRDMGAEGKYGLCEAVDFTPSRTGGKGRAVRMFMAHHLGMSLVAADNALNDGIMVKRFMSDRNMAAYSELLQEKIPAEAVVLHRTRRDVPDKPPRASAEKTVRHDSGDIRRPACCLLTGGDYSTLVSDIGHTKSMWNDIEIFRFLPEQDGKCHGIDFEITSDGGVLPLTYRKSGIAHGAEFTSNHAKLTAKNDVIAASMTITVPEGERGELRTVSVSRTAKGGLTGEIRVSFAPVLARAADYEAHPLFSKLSLEARSEDNTLMIRRRPRGGEGEIFLAVTADKEAIFAVEGDEMKRYSTVMDVSARVPVEVRGEGTATVKLAFCVGRTEREAAEGAKRILASKEPRVSRADRLRAELGLTQKQAEAAMAYLTELVYVTPERRLRQGAPVSRDSLWALGLSGDLPILAADAVEPDRAVELVKQWCYLTDCGFPFDLALITEDGGDYRMPTGRAVGEYLARVNRSGRLGDRVKLVDKNDKNAAALTALADCRRGE